MLLYTVTEPLSIIQVPKAIFKYKSSDLIG